MALQCPQCSNPIEADFGVVTCSQCQSVLFVDMEGNVQLSDNSGSDPEPPAGLFEAPLTSSASSTDSPSESWVPDENPVSFDFSSNPEAEDFDSGNYESAPSEVSLELEDDEPVQESEPEPISDFESPMEAAFVGENVSSEMNNEDPNDLSDIAQFSNSEEPVGPLSYSVLIEAIDTQDLRQQIFEALSDPKFQWDSKDLLKKIKMGKLVLENINPVKASILVHRLQALPVKVSWTQNVYS